MRSLALLLACAALAGCVSDKYTALPEPEGPLMASYATRPLNTDNNLVPHPLAPESAHE